MLVVNGLYICTSLQIYSLDYAKYNISASRGQPFIRPRMLYGLSMDLSLDDPILPSSDCKTRDLLLSKIPSVLAM